MTDRQVTLTIAGGSSWSEAVHAALKVEPRQPPILVLPASLSRTDPLASAVRHELRSAGVTSHLVLPPHPAAALLGRGWIDAIVAPPDGPPSPIALPPRFLGGEPLWSVTDVDVVGGSGPYVLDLVARYVHPAARLRHLASRRRGDAVVDVNLVARPARCLVGKVLGDARVVGVVDDPIAAELFALALADEDLPPARATTGPWEDRVVQRATEIEIGIQIPHHLSIDLVLRPGDDALGAVIERVLARIGVSIA